MIECRFLRQVETGFIESEDEGSGSESSGNGQAADKQTTLPKEAEDRGTETTVNDTVSAPGPGSPVKRSASRSLRKGGRTVRKWGPVTTSLLNRS